MIIVACYRITIFRNLELKIDTTIKPILIVRFLTYSDFQFHFLESITSLKTKLKLGQKLSSGECLK